MSLILSLFVSAAASAQSTPSPPLPIQPDEIKWTPNPAIPPGGMVALLVGRPAEAGRYVFRLKFPPDYKVMPHSHPEERIYTVLEGTWTIGIGEGFDQSRLKHFPAGSVYVLPANTPHFHFAQSARSVVQVNAVGPTATIYVDPAHDPRPK